MIVLALEGALGGFSTAIARDDRIVSSVALEGNVALEAGLSAVREALERADLGASDLDRVAVGLGPGGFTGLRITITYAKALAQAWSLPLTGISSFDALEYGLEALRVLTVVVGRPGIISARYRDEDGEARASGPIREVLASVLESAGAKTIPVAGGSEDVFASLAEAGFTVQPHLPLVTPPAATVALLGARAEPFASAHAARADYGEAPAAKVPVFRPTERKR